MLGIHRLVLRVNAEYIVITICYISWRHTAGKRRRACEARIVVAQKMLKLLQNLAFFSQRDKNATIFAHRNQRERQLAQSWIALFLLRLNAVREFLWPGRTAFSKGKTCHFSALSPVRKFGDHRAIENPA
jgi:hypothetical protein